MKTAVVLLSGGLDSTTTLYLAKEKGFGIQTISFDYGQRHSIELEYASYHASALGFDHFLIRIQPELFEKTALVGDSINVPEGESPERNQIPVTYVPARNLLFLSYAVSFAESRSINNIFIGANALDYSGYPDCRPAFLDAFEKTANLGTRGGVEGNGIVVHAPLIAMSKAEIVKEANRLGIDLYRTSSCYQPDHYGKPCKVCDSCQLREKGFQENGLIDPRRTA